MSAHHSTEKTSSRLPSGFTFAEFEGEHVFLGGTRLLFASGFTALTGESGVGKSTTVEALAYATRPGEPVSPMLRKLIQKNLKDGLIRAGWRTDFGAEYIIIREPGKAARVLDATGREVPIPVDQLVRAEFYSTHALQEIAMDTAAQLALLDRFVGADLDDVQRTIDSTKRELRENATKLLELAGVAADLKGEADLAAGAEERLKAMQPQQGADAAALKVEMDAKALREREKEAFRSGQSAVHTTHRLMREAATQAMRELGAVVDEGLVAGRNGDVMRRLSAHLRAVAAIVEKSVADAGRACDLAAADMNKDDKALDSAHEQQQQVYERLLARNKEAQDQDTARTEAEKQLAKATSARKTFELRRAERTRFEEKRRELLLRLSGVVDQRYELRKGVAQSLTEMLGPNIRVTVSRAADDDLYEETLAGGLANATRDELARERAGAVKQETGKPKGSNMKVADIVAKIVEKLTPQQVVAAVRRNDADWLCDRPGLDLARAQKVIARLEDTDALYELEMLELVDKPCIELKDGEFKNVDSVSTGQKAAVLLPIILLHGTHPIILDQPEEGLFAAFKATTVARILAEVKKRRQIILVTHDPNLVILPVADRVNELGSKDGKGYLKASGTMAERRDTVMNVLDGGDEAFIARMAFYGFKK